MHPDQTLLDELNDAEDAGKVGYVRHLCATLIEEWPNHLPTLLQYAEALTQLSQYDEASRSLEHADTIVSDRQRHLVLVQRGFLLMKMGDFASAESLFLQAHALDPDDASYLTFAGWSAFRQGDVLRAEKLARKAVACSGASPEAHCNLGKYLLSQKRYTEARDCYLTALRIAPEYSRAQRRLADVESLIKNDGEQ